MWEQKGGVTSRGSKGRHWGVDSVKDSGMTGDRRDGGKGAQLRKQLKTQQYSRGRRVARHGGVV